MRTAIVALLLLDSPLPARAHGGGLNACGCHFNRKTGECHCHRPKGCGCECERNACKKVAPDPSPPPEAKR